MAKLYLLMNPNGLREQIIEIVIRASSEERARELAADEATRLGDQASHWLGPSLTTCEQIPQEGPDEVICVDFNEP
ncbi:hypothetical protein J1C56_16170 [Aminobacter anthyllidis]|uniref:Uncharacterized protein n=1 Tax=Aminobacter anthyllidis TaxID=1035067 RepID=A0A9X1ACR9_9HYPH|nr:hypothetical protein [Aminobacter anthyllidis]MBT1157132.1 hypothetical protein [Aminobacter anthyllidis]